MLFTVEGYRASNGEEPYMQALARFKKVSPKLHDKVLLWTNHYVQDDQYHHMPYTEMVGPDLFALRVQHGRHFARIFFVKTPGRHIWLLNGYYKDSNKIPKPDLESAQRLCDEIHLSQKEA